MSGKTLLAPDVEIQPTPAMAAGKAYVTQCSGCGLLACVTDLATAKRLGICPVCGADHWWLQTLPVGPFVQPSTPAGDVQ